MLRDSKRECAQSLFAFLSCLVLLESPSELCVLRRNSVTSKICECLPLCCVTKQKQREKWTLLLAEKPELQTQGQQGKYCLRNLGGFVISWKEMQLEAESRGFQRVKLPCLWVKGGGHPLVDPNCSQGLCSTCNQPQTGNVGRASFIMGWKCHLQAGVPRLRQLSQARSRPRAAGTR